MTLCSVVGSVVSTVKHASLEGRKLLICRPIDPRTKEPAGEEMVALDTVQAGVGDCVLVCDEGNAARLMIGDKNAPIRTVVFAVVDAVE